MKEFLIDFGQTIITSFALYMIFVTVMAFITWDPTWIYFDQEFIDAMRLMIGVGFIITLVKFVAKFGNKVEEKKDGQ